MTTETPSTPAFYPGLQYRDADAGMQWLEDVLGCERREDHRDEDGNVVHAELDFRGATVMLSSAGVAPTLRLPRQHSCLLPHGHERCRQASCAT